MPGGMLDIEFEHRAEGIFDDVVVELVVGPAGRVIDVVAVEIVGDAIVDVVEPPATYWTLKWNMERANFFCVRLGTGCETASYAKQASVACSEKQSPKLGWATEEPTASLRWRRPRRTGTKARRSAGAQGASHAWENLQSGIREEASILVATGGIAAQTDAFAGQLVGAFISGIPAWTGDFLKARG